MINYYRLLQNLNNLYKECSVPGWDGYNGHPISKKVYFEAKKLLRNLLVVTFIPMPEIVPEPSGAIAFEWSEGKRQTFIASVDGNNEIVYAGFFSMNKVHGTEHFRDTLPSVLVENLRRLYL